MVMNDVSGLLHIGAIRYYLKVRCGIALAQELTACGAAAVIYSNDRHLMHRLTSVQISVKQRIEQRYHNEEHQHAYIGHRLAEFLSRYVKQIFYPHTVSSSLR